MLEKQLDSGQNQTSLASMWLKMTYISSYGTCGNFRVCQDFEGQFLVAKNHGTNPQTSSSELPMWWLIEVDGDETRNSSIFFLGIQSPNFRWWERGGFLHLRNERYQVVRFHHYHSQVRWARIPRVRGWGGPLKLHDYWGFWKIWKSWVNGRFLDHQIILFQSTNK